MSFETLGSIGIIFEHVVWWRHFFVFLLRTSPIGLLYSPPLLAEINFYYYWCLRLLFGSKAPHAIRSPDCTKRSADNAGPNTCGPRIS